MELQKIALKNRIIAASVETNKNIFIYLVKHKIQYGVDKNGVKFNISELSDSHLKRINNIIDKSEPKKNNDVEKDKNLVI